MGSPINQYGEPLNDSYRGPGDDSFRGQPPQDERYVKCQIIGCRSELFQPKKCCRGSSVVYCLTQDRGVAGFEPHRHHCVVSLSKHINPSLVLAQPRKTRPYINERLLIGCKESNQANKTML